jgi:pimeloyl-ACP methyl ester carboxylesterase
MARNPYLRLLAYAAKRGVLFGAGLATAAAAAHYAEIHRKKNYDMSFLEGDLIFVPGFKGTHLHDAKTGEKVYMTVPLALNLINPDLRLETDWEHPDGPNLVPGEVISDFGGGLVNFCGHFSQLMKDHQAESNGNFRYHEFAYDWRQDNLTSARKLANFVNGIYAQNGGRKVTLVGFSMGGLLSMHLIHTHPELVSGLLLVGSPVSSLRGILKVLNTGDKLLLNPHAHADEVQSTWMSGYSMLCTHGRDMFVDADTGESIHLDLWNPETWIKRRLTTAVRRAIDEGREEEARRFMTETLRRAKEFNKDMRKFDPEIRYPNIATVRGENRTMGYTYKARFDANGALAEVDWWVAQSCVRLLRSNINLLVTTHRENPVVTVASDGTAPTYSTALPPGIPVLGTWESHSLHRSMVNDLPVIVDALQHIAEGKTREVQMDMKCSVEALMGQPQEMDQLKEMEVLSAA